jgi:hypothetical protein
MDDESLKRLRDIYEMLGSQPRSDKKEKADRVKASILVIG